MHKLLHFFFVTPPPLGIRSDLSNWWDGKGNHGGTLCSGLYGFFPSELAAHRPPLLIEGSLRQELVGVRQGCVQLF